MLSEFQHFSTIPGFCSCLQVPHKNATLYRRRNHEKGRWNGAPRNPLIRGKAACNRCQTPGVRVKKVGFYDSTFCQLFTRFSATPKIWKGEIHSKTHDKFIYKFINIMVAFFFLAPFPEMIQIWHVCCRCGIYRVIINRLLHLSLELGNLLPINM